MNKRLCVLGFFLLFASILVMQCVGNSSQDELLITWGQTTDQQCHIWIANPYTQKQVQFLAEHNDCNYMIADVAGHERLVHIQHNLGVISIYDIGMNKLALQSTITAGAVEIFSSPQWDRQSRIYFSGISRNRQYIYRLDNDKLEQLTHFQTGMAYDPILAPNNQYLAYRFSPKARNIHECYECSSYYHILNLDTLAEIHLEDITTNSWDTLYHHKLFWSPTGEYAALTIVDNGQEYIGVFNIITGQIIDRIYASIFEPSLYGWITDHELIYTSSVDVEIEGFEYPLPIRRVYTYSIETRLSSELGDFPLIDSSGNRFTLYDINWTADGKLVAGITHEKVIITHRKEEGNSTFGYQQIDEPRAITNNGNIYSWYFFDPVWSLSGKWLAYSSIGETISIVDQDGKEVYSLNIPGIVNYKFAWLHL